MLILNFLIPIFGLLIAKINLTHSQNNVIGYRQKSDYYAAFQQSKNAFFTLITTSNTNQVTEQDGTVSSIVVTTNSYIYDSFTLNIVTRTVYNSGNITKLNTESSIYELSKNQSSASTQYASSVQLSCSEINENEDFSFGNTSLWLYAYSFGYFKASDLMNNFNLNPNLNSLTCSQDGQIFNFPLFENLVYLFLLN